MPKSVDEYVAAMRNEIREEHYRLGRELFEVSQTMYFPDMYIIAAMKRSLCLLRGFADLVASRNYVAAAPLVRLQMDNALRAAALAMVKDPHDVAQRVLAGEPISKMRDRKGERLTDTLLRKRLSEQWPWVNQIYERGSGYVHFSDAHILLTFRSADGEPSEVFSISEENELVPEHAYSAAADSFSGGTVIFLQYVKAWIREKRRIVADIGDKQR